MAEAEKREQRSVLLAVGGGKGGTGKSTVALALAARLAAAGEQVVLADLDFGGANLHTMLGLPATGTSLVDFLYRKSDRRLRLGDCLVATPFPGLRLLPGDGFMPGIANLEFWRKRRLLRELLQLSGDFVVCDLGAGSSYNVLDFFLLADYGILLLTAEATAILNGYEFMKNCLFRKFTRTFAKEQEVLELILSFRQPPDDNRGSVAELLRLVNAKYPQAGRRLAEICARFSPLLLMNREIVKNEVLGKRLDALSRKHLNVGITFLGSLPPEPGLRRGILTFLLSRGPSRFSQRIDEVAGWFRNRVERF